MFRQTPPDATDRLGILDCHCPDSKAHAPDHPNDSSAGHRPRIPAAQASGACAHAGVPVRQRDGLLPGGDARTPARRPSCSTSTRSEWSAAAAARAAPRTSTSTTGRTSHRRCSRLCFRAGSTPPWAVDASGNPNSRRPSCRSRHDSRPFPAAAAKRSSARCSSLSATRSKRRVTNSTRACRRSARAGCSRSRSGRRAG